MSPTVKMAVDLGPVIVFLATYFVAGRISPGQDNQALPPAMMWATCTFIGATLVSLAVTYVIERKIHPVPLITAGIVLVFGGLTLSLHDQRFIKIKPTILYATFAATLLIGLSFGKMFLRNLLGHVLHLTEQGWRVLTIRFGVFFILSAIANEIVWRTVATPTWVIFKAGFIGVTFAFTVWQMLFVTRYQINPENTDKPAS